MNYKPLRNKCDKLIQEYYVPKNSMCLICGYPTKEMHHFIQKKQSRALRYDEKNLIPLCKSDHFKIHFHGDPAIIKDIIDIKGDDWFDYIQSKRHQIQKENKEFYTNIIKRLEE